MVVVALIILSAFPSLIAPYDPAQQDLTQRLDGPSGSHPLGTDGLGRDLLSRLIFGTRTALGVAVPAVLGGLVAGLIIGMAAGYLRGRVDSVLLVIMDTLQTFPAVVLALALLALLGPSLLNVIVVIGIAFTPGYARIARALTMQVKENPFIKVERSLGASHRRIIGVHILPNIGAPLLILLAMDLPAAITTEAGLSFLGVGVQAPTASWGGILADGFDHVRETPWPVLFASLALMIATLGFTTLGEALRDAMDPRVAGLKSWKRS